MEQQEQMRALHGLRHTVRVPKPGFDAVPVSSSTVLADQSSMVEWAPLLELGSLLASTLPL